MEQLKKAKNMCRLVLVLLFLHATVCAQRGLGTNTPHTSAILELQSTTKGFLIPRLTSSEINSIPAPAEGLMVYCTDKKTIFIRVDGVWKEYYRRDQIENHHLIAVDANGNVGIGTNAPAAKLDMSGNMRMTGTSPQIKLEDTNNNAHDFWVHVNNNKFYILTDTNNDNGWNGDMSFPLELENSTSTGSLYGEKIMIQGSSDRRWKKNISTLHNSLDKIAALRGVSYQWRQDQFPNKNFSDGPQVGVIAQELEEVFPELVSEDDQGYKSVDYRYLVAPLIEAVKELKQQNEAQKKEIEKQQAVNKDIITRLMALESKNKE